MDLVTSYLHSCHDLGIEPHVVLVDKKSISGIRPLSPGREGLIFSASPSSQYEFQLTIDVLTKRPIVVATVEGESKQVVSLRNIPTQSERRRYIRIVRSIQTELQNIETGRRAHSTKHRSNNVRLIRVKEGRFQMWEVVIPTRIIDDTAHFFLTIQKLYEGQLYQNSGQIYIPKSEFPGFHRWPSLQSFLAKRINAELLPLAPAETEPIDNFEFISDYHGTVQFFCFASGYGRILTNSGSAAVHWRDIKSDKLFAHLLPEALVKFESFELKDVERDGLRDCTLAAKGVEEITVGTEEVQYA